jgi:hypothetical protein
LSARQDPLEGMRAEGETNKTTGNGTVAPGRLEAELWKTADALRGSMDAAEYKHVVLGLIFLKYISDAFEEYHAELETQISQGADPEDPDEYRAEGIFWVPPEARWSHLKAQARQPTIGTLVDDAMAGVERDNPTLNGVLPKNYARPALDKQRLGQIIDLVSNIAVGDRESRSQDILGDVYEYFLAQFASAEGKKGGEFYTPRSVVRLLVQMLEPYKGRVYDPCCGSSGMFVQSEEFVKEHRGRLGDISIYGQESNYTTWCLARMNLAIRGIEGQIAHGDTFHNDRHPDLKAELPKEALRPWEREPGYERAYLFSVLGRMVQMRLREHCYPQFNIYTRGGHPTGRYALTYGFHGLLGAIWIQMAWLLESEGRRVTFCKLPDCRRVVSFEPGEDLEADPDAEAHGKRKTRKDRVFCKGRGCKQKYDYRRKHGWPGHP